MDTWAVAEVKFDVFCPICGIYSARVQQEMAHARLMQLMVDGKPITCKCTHCGKELIVKEIRK